MRQRLLIAVVVLCAASFGCAQAGALSDQDKAAIQKLHDDYAQAWNAEKPDFASLAKASYAPEAQVLMPNMPAITGVDAIGKGLASGPPARNFRFSDTVIEGHGDVAFARGAYEGDWVMPSGEPAHEKGKFVTTLKKQADGSWKVVYDIWNSDAPPAGLLVPTGALKTDASPELKALEWFTGTWQMDLDAKESPLGPKGKITAAMDCRWFASGQHIICTTEGTTPAGPYHEVFVIHHDAAAKTYKGYDVDNAGLNTPFALTFKDGKWTWDYDLKMGGKAARFRVTAFDLVKDACSVKQELSTGGAWTLVSEGKFRKITG